MRGRTSTSICMVLYTVREGSIIMSLTMPRIFFYGWIRARTRRNVTKSTYLLIFGEGEISVQPNLQVAPHALPVRWRLGSGNTASLSNVGVSHGQSEQTRGEVRLRQASGRRAKLGQVLAEPNSMKTTDGHTWTKSCRFCFCPSSSFISLARVSIKRGLIIGVLYPL
jgi:hypothetical protein